MLRFQAFTARMAGLAMIALGVMTFIGAPLCDALKYSPNEMTLEDTGTFDNETLEQNKDDLVDLLKRSFFNGNLEGIGILAWRLIQVDPNNADLRALYALHLFSKGLEKDGQEQLKEAQRLDADNPLTLYAQSMAALKNKKYDTAIQVANTAIAKDKSHPFPHSLIGSAYFYQNRLDQSAKSFQTAIKLNPNFAPAHTNLGLISLKTNDFKSAREYFMKSLEVQPDTASPHYGLALVYNHEGKIAYALAHLQKSLAIKSDQLEALEKLAELQLKAGFYSEAEKTASKLKSVGLESADIVAAEAHLHMGEPQKALGLLKKVDGKDVHASYLTGLSFMQIGQYKDALNQMDTVLKANRNHTAAHLCQFAILNYTGQPVNPEKVMSLNGSDALKQLKNFITGTFFAQQQQWPRAYQLWRDASGLYPNFSLDGVTLQDLEKNLKPDEFKHIIISAVYSAQRMDPAATKQLLSALQINPDSILSNYLIAQSYKRTGEKQKAVSHFEASLRSASEFMAALIALGDIGFSTQDAALASKYYSKALTKKPNPTLIYRLGTVYEAIGEFDNAEAQYQRLIDDYPKAFIGYNQLAWLYAKNGVKLDSAVKLAKKADALQPNNPIILDTLGWVYYQKKDYATAEKRLRRAIEITDQIPSILYHYGAVMRATGNEDQARLYMRKALNITDQFDGAEEAKKYIRISLKIK